MNDWLDAERRVERAQQLSESHQWEEALAEIDAALAINPQNASWNAHRGFILDELDLWEEAVEAYRSALELEPGDQDIAMALGIALMRLGRFSTAVEGFEDLARLYPDFEPSYCHRIAAYAELGAHDQAEQMFYVAQELNESCPHCFMHIGSSLAARGQTERALYCWQRVLDLEPQYAGVNRRIAQAHRAQGRFDLAKKFFLREYREDARNTDLLFDLADLALKTGDLDAAAAKFTQITELEPYLSDAHFALGQIRLSQGTPDAALACFRSARSAHDGETPEWELRYHMGEALLQLGRPQDARHHLETASNEAKGNVSVLMLLGSCLLTLDKPSRAAERFREIIAIDADQALAHHQLGVCQLRLGRTAAGLDHCLMAILLKPDFGPAVQHAGLAYMQLGKWREAKVYLKRARRLDPENAALERLERGMGWMRLRRVFRGILGKLRLTVRH